MKKDDQSGKIMIYTGNSGTPGIHVRLENETVWLTQAQLSELFGVTTQNITIHLKNIFAEEELEKNRTCKEYLQVQKKVIAK